MNWIDEFAGLSALDSNKREWLLTHSSIIDVPQNTVIFGSGKNSEDLLLLLSGTVRVEQTSEKGREIVLYRVRGGESCVMTSACMLAFEKFSAQGVTETDVKAVAISQKIFDQLVAESEEFRQFIFSAFSNRILELFHTIEVVAFQRIDVRLAEKILELAHSNAIVKVTHQQLSAELGTAREVISRQVAEFQRRNWVKQTRGTLEILDSTSLEKLARA